MINARVINEFSRMGVDPKAPIVISRDGDDIHSTIYAINNEQFFDRNFDKIAKEEYDTKRKKMASKKEVTISLDWY